MVPNNAVQPLPHPQSCPPPGSVTPRLRLPSCARHLCPLPPEFHDDPEHQPSVTHWPTARTPTRCPVTDSRARPTEVTRRATTVSVHSELSPPLSVPQRCPGRARRKAPGTGQGCREARQTWPKSLCRHKLLHLPVGTAEGTLFCPGGCLSPGGATTDAGFASAAPTSGCSHHSALGAVTKALSWTFSAATLSPATHRIPSGLPLKHTPPSAVTRSSPGMCREAGTAV